MSRTQIIIKYPTGWMRIIPDLLIREMTLDKFRKWLKLFVRYGEDEDLPFFIERLEAAQGHYKFVGDQTMLTRCTKMMTETRSAITKEGRQWTLNK